MLFLALLLVFYERHKSAINRKEEHNICRQIKKAVI